MEMLIDKVRQHEILFNIRSTDYRDQRMRQEAWNEIGNHLHISAYKAKENWEKLRRCFTNVLSRRRLKKKSTKKYIPWKYENQMSFLLPYLEIRKPRNRFGDTFCSQNVTEFENTEQNILNQTNEDLEFSNQLLNLKKEKDIETNETFEFSKRQKISIQKKDETERPSLNNNKLNEKSILTDFDDTDMFFLSLSRMTKKLPKTEQASIKLIISNAVLKAEMKHEEAQEKYTVDTSCLVEPILSPDSEPPDA